MLRYALAEEPKSLDLAVVESANTGEMLQNIFEGLVLYDKNSRIGPWLADSWELSPDRRTYTFHLNPQATFHPPYARPVTAADVKWSIERALLPETKSPIAPAWLDQIVGAKDVLAGKTRDCAGIAVIDPRTVAITTVRPAAYLLAELTNVAVYCREAVEKGGGHIDASNAIGTGPFRLTEYQRGRRVVLEANPAYYRGRPKINRIERPIVIDAHTARVQYDGSETDLCRDSFADYAKDQRDPQLAGQSLLMPLAGVNYLVMQPERQPAFRDRRVRRAFAEAIDRDAIVRIAFHGVMLKATGFLPPGTLGYNPRLKSAPFDPADARRLLAGAGYGASHPFPHLVLEYIQQPPEIGATAAIIRDNLKENLGIAIDLREREAATFFGDAGKKRMPFYMMGWVALDPHDYLAVLMRTGGRFNTFGYSNPHLDEAVDSGDAEPDTAKRALDYARADQIAVDDMVAVPIDYHPIPYLVKPYVHDLDYNLEGLTPHVHTYVQR